jgi:hypothetical protein
MATHRKFARVIWGHSVKFNVLTSALLVLLSAASVQAAGTDIVRKPAKWRGTLLEGTDALIATETYGYPMFIQSGETVAKQFEPKPVPGSQLASEFKKLCIDTGYDPASLATAAPSSSFALSNRKFLVVSAKGGASFAAEVWHSPEARVQIWNGDTSALAGKGTQSRYRNGAMISGFKSKYVLSPSCNLTVMTTDLHDPAEFLTAMTALTGAAPVKSVVKSNWADGHWELTGPSGAYQIFYSMTDLERSEQLVHIAVARSASKD